MNPWKLLFGSSRRRNQPARRPAKASLRVEGLESRDLMSNTPLPVLMVIANQDFYFKEYNDTRNALLSRGVGVAVAASTTAPSVPHPGSGQDEAGVSGVVIPDLALADADAGDYSAIVFVGGWGSSVYQYAYNDPDFNGVADNFYYHGPYNGDDLLNDGVIAPQKVAVNNLINDFVAQDKYVAAICHGVTVLAWARVDGVSPLAGRQVSVPLTVGSPGQYFDGADHSYPYWSGQRDQVVANGGLANTVSGQYGNPGTVADDVVVDGRIITAENYDSATEFGRVIAGEVLAGLGPVVMSGDDLVVRGTGGNDVIYLWSNQTANSVSAWVNGTSYGPFTLGPSGRVIVQAGDGNDQVFATDLRAPAAAHGGAGHDLLVGGSAGDLIDGGDGVDRAWGGAGDDVLLGGAGNDFLYGREGDNVLVGGDGDDYLEGLGGRDLLIGGLGADRLFAGGGEDLLVGGATSYDADVVALAALRDLWTFPDLLAARVATLSDAAASLRLRVGDTVQDDGAADALVGGGGDDWLFDLGADQAYGMEAGDWLTS